MKNNIFVIILLLILSIPAIKSLLPKGGYTSHDLTHQVVRQIDIDRLLSEGQFPPRWSGNLNNGFGYPLFNFIYPTPSLTGEVFHKAGFDYVESVKAVFFLSMIIGVFGMYLFLNSLFPKNRLGAFLGSMFFLYAPVRFLDVYVSAALGNALALGILPFVFWSIVRTYQSKKWSIPIGAMSLTLLITSHNVTALMFAPVILIFTSILIIKSKNKTDILKRILILFGLGLGLSAFFWIPSIFEKKYIIYDSVMGNSWQNQFPSLSQIIHSPWGYGLSHPEVPEPGDLSYQVGLAQIFGTLTLVPLLFVFKKSKEILTWGVFSLLIFLTGIFFMLKISFTFWQYVPLLYLVQFPARFMALSVFASSVGVSLLIKYAPFRKILFLILLILVLYASRNHLNINEPYNPGMDYYLNLLETTASSNEHLPIGAFAPSNISPGKLQILTGVGKINILENKSSKVTAELIITKDASLRFNQFYFPGWILKINGKKISFDYQGVGYNSDLPVFKLREGKYYFEANFADTTDRQIANTISIIALTSLGFILLLNKR